MKKTANYGLNLWEKTDRIQMEDFNADNAKIEAALAAAGNCKIVTGTYIGSGKYHSNTPNTLTFNGTPLALLIVGAGWFLCAIQGSTSAPVMGDGNDTQSVVISWSENKVTWYNTSSSIYQMNWEKQPYHYVALLSANG